jgi:TonB family protein
VRLKSFLIALGLNLLLFIGVGHYFALQSPSLPVKVRWVNEPKYRLPMVMAKPTPLGNKFANKATATPPGYTAALVLPDKAHYPKPASGIKGKNIKEPAGGDSLDSLKEFQIQGTGFSLSSSSAGSSRSPAAADQPALNPPAVQAPNLSGLSLDAVVSTQAPVPIYTPLPAYPASALEEEAAGKVLVKALISESGSVVKVELIGSSGNPSLDREAAEAVQSWQFKPALENHSPVKAWVKLCVHFALR